MAASRRASAVLVLILIGGFGARIWGVAFGLPNTTAHPDEIQIVGVSSGMLFSSLNPHFFHWPSLEFYVVAAIYRIGWQFEHWRGVFHHKWEITGALNDHPATFILVPRLLAVAAGTATIWCVYKFTRDTFDRMTALVAAFLIAVAFLHVRDSHFGVTDAPMTWLAMAAIIPLGRAFRDPLTRRHWIKAGMLAGLTATTKYNGGIVAATALGVAAVICIDARGRGGAATRRAALAGLMSFGIATVLTFVAGTPFSVLDFPDFLEGLRFNSTHLMAGHGIDLGRGWWYHVVFSLRYGLGLPLLIAAIAGMVLLGVRSWRTAVLVCTFPILYYLMVGRGYTVFVRYATPLVPFLCITAAVAVVALVRRLLKSAPPRVPLAAAFVAALIAIPSIRSAIAFDRLAAQPDTRVLAAAWLDAHRQPSDWIHEEFPASLHPVFGRRPGVNVAKFDADRGLFVSDQDTDEVVTPDWIAMGSSALKVYTDLEEPLRQILEKSYELVATYPATSAPELGEIFDRQDHFFLPYSDFSHRLRSGPDIRIYRRIR